jgi:hypothetical protein
MRDEDDRKLKYLGGIPYLSDQALRARRPEGWRAKLGELLLRLASTRALLGLALALAGLMLMLGALIDLWLQA